jgi:hypothetical protein
MSMMGCTETAVTNYQFTLLNMAEERKSHSHCSGSPKSRKQRHFWLVCIMTLNRHSNINICFLTIASFIKLSLMVLKLTSFRHNNTLVTLSLMSLFNANFYGSFLDVNFSRNSVKFPFQLCRLRWEIRFLTWALVSEVDSPKPTSQVTTLHARYNSIKL